MGFISLADIHNIDRLSLGAPAGVLSNSTAIGLDDNGNLVFNEAGAAIDIRMEGDTNPNLFFLDGLNNRIGIGAVPTDGLLHIASGSAGVVSADVGADELVIEGLGTIGLSLLCEDTGLANIFIGNPANSVAYAFVYNAATPIFRLQRDADVVWDVTPTGITFNEGNLSTLDFTVETESGVKFFVDAGNNSVHIGNSQLTGAGDGDLVMANNKTIRWSDAAAVTSANFGIKADTFDNLFFDVPGAGNAYIFNFAGIIRGRFISSNSGMGLLFETESSADQAAPVANAGVLYTKDAAGRTNLFWRDNTGVRSIDLT